MLSPVFPLSMKLFDVLRGTQLEPFWTYSCDAVLWRILFSPQRHIVIETRDQERKRASFLCLDEETGKPQWEGLQLKEQWWVGMETVHDHYLILHEFPKPDLPEHRGIWVVDVETGRMLWEKEELSFWFAFKDRLYAYEQRFDRRVGHVLDIVSGALLETYDEDLGPLLAVRQLAVEERDDETLFPRPGSTDEANPAIEQIIRKETKGARVVGPVEFLEHRNLLILNYHTHMKESTPESLRLRSHLRIVDLQRRRNVFTDILFEGGIAPVPDSFFVRHDAIYFVKDQHTLVSLRPWKS